MVGSRQSNLRSDNPHPTAAPPVLRPSVKFFAIFARILTAANTAAYARHRARFTDRTILSNWSSSASVNTDRSPPCRGPERLPIGRVCEAEGANSGNRLHALILACEVAVIIRTRLAAARTPWI
jgi:hypothetical protein